ncbi:MAG: hypothetical protein AAF958_11095 [Planctomycetota bacterium]
MIHRVVIHRVVIHRVVIHRVVIHRVVIHRWGIQCPKICGSIDTFRYYVIIPK